MVAEKNANNVDLATIFDIKIFQSLMSDFSKVTGMGLALVDLEGKIVALAGWQNFCRQIHSNFVTDDQLCIEGRRGPSFS